MVLSISNLSATQQEAWARRLHGDAAVDRHIAQNGGDLETSFPRKGTEGYKLQQARANASQTARQDGIRQALRILNARRAHPRSDDLTDKTKKAGAKPIALPVLGSSESGSSTVMSK